MTSPSAPRSAPDAPSRLAGWRVPLALAAVVLAVLGPFVKQWTAQPGSRFALTAALADGHTVRIDDYVAGTRPTDRIDATDGHVYSDKAPAQPVFAMPFYAVARAVGAEPATTVRVDGNLGLWWVTLWSSTVPCAALAVVMYQVARRRQRPTAAAAALALVLGTPFLVFGAELYGHALAALLGFGSWALVSAERPPSAIRLAGAGALAAGAVATEYPMAIVAAAVTIWLIVRGVRAGLGWFVLGAIPPTLLLAVYHTAAFGGPLSSPYSQKAATYATEDLATGPPRPDVLLRLLVSDRGLVLTPIVLAGLVGAVLVVVRRRPGRADAWVALSVFAAFWLFEGTRRSAWPGPLGGEMPAPRHLLPALPFLAAPLAWLWARRPRLCLGLTAVGTATMSLPLVLLHLIPPDAPYLDWYRQQLDEHGVVPTVLTLGLGPLGWLVHLALVVAAGWFLARSLAADRRSVATARPGG